MAGGVGVLHRFVLEDWSLALLVCHDLANSIFAEVCMTYNCKVLERLVRLNHFHSLLKRSDLRTLLKRHSAGGALLLGEDTGAVKLFDCCEELPRNRHSRESGNPDFQQVCTWKVWIPAFAGMTALSEEFSFRFHGLALTKIEIEPEIYNSIQSP